MGAYLESQKCTHGDIRPHTVFITPQGRYQLVDATFLKLQEVVGAKTFSPVASPREKEGEGRWEAAGSSAENHKEKIPAGKTNAESSLATPSPAEDVGNDCEEGSADAGDGERSLRRVYTQADVL